MSCNSASSYKMCSAKDHQNFFMTFSYHHFRFAILSLTLARSHSLSLSPSSLGVLMRFCSVTSMEKAIEMNFLKLSLYGSYNSGKIQDNFAWCASNAWFGSRYGSIYRWRVKFYASHWNVVHDLWFKFMFKFMPCTIPVQTGNSAKKDQHKYLALKHFATTKMWTKQTKKNTGGLIVSLLMFFFIRSFIRFKDHSFFTRFAQSFNTLKWQTFTIAF